MERTDLVVQAEELGIELEQHNLERLDGLTAKAEQIVKDFSQSNENLKQIGVSPVDPEYLSTIRSLENAYLIGLAAVCLLEAALGYAFASGALKERKQYKLQKQHDILAGRVYELEERLGGYEQNAESNQADASA